MGVQSRNMNNISTTRKNSPLAENMSMFIDGDTDKLFSGDALIGFDVIDSFCWEPISGELLVANRFQNTHYQTIREFGNEKDVKKYLLGYINFPGTAKDIPSGWMTEMVREKTIAIRTEGSVNNNNDYRRIQKIFNILKEQGAPLDWTVYVLFGESSASRGGFLNDNPKGKLLTYNNLDELELLSEREI